MQKILFAIFAYAEHIRRGQKRCYLNKLVTKYESRSTCIKALNFFEIILQHFIIKSLKKSYLHRCISRISNDFNRKRVIRKFDSIIWSVNVFTFDATGYFPALNFIFKIPSWKYLEIYLLMRK